MAISKIKSESIDLTDTGYTFGDLLVSGDLTIDTSSLTVDSANNRVGIGTTTPSSDLHVAKSGSGIIFQTERTDASGAFSISHTSQKTYLNTDQDYIFLMNGTEAMRIDQSRNVGIGTSSPRTRLDLGSNGVSHTRWGTWSELGEESSHNSLIIGNNIYVDGSASKVRSTTVNGYRAIKMKYNTGITFHTVNASVTTNDALGYERMRIDPSGNVGIGTDSPSSTQRLTLKGDFSTIESGILFDQAGNQTVVSHADATSPSFIISNKTANGVLRFDTNSTERLRITSAGNVGIGTSAPPKPFTLEFDNSDTDVNTGNGFGGGIAGDGLLIENTNTTIGSYANLDFRSGSADGRIAFEVQGTNNGDFHFITDGGGTATTKLFIENAGNVGIGTTSPFGPLHLNGGLGGPSTSGNMADAGFIVSNGTGGRAVQIGTDSTDSFNYIQSAYVNATNVANDLAFFIGASERMRINSSGNVGIGTSNPGYRLQVAGNALIGPNTNGSEAAPYISLDGDGYTGFHWLDGTAYYIGQNSNARSLRIYSGGNEAAGAQLSAGGTSFGTYSDERLKKDITDLTNGLDKISAIRAVKFKYKTDADDYKTRIGIIAQSLVGQVDEALDLSRLKDTDTTEYYNVRYQDLIPVLVKGMQEQQTQIEELKARLSALENS